jgi:hypothetical protein
MGKREKNVKSVRITMNKCPACGYQSKSNRNISLDIRDLLKVRNKRTREQITRIAKLIINNVPSDSRYEFHKFLFGIKECRDQLIDYGIETYYNNRSFEHGKGFAYLRTVISNSDKNHDTVVENERKRLGSTPPIIQ